MARVGRVHPRPPSMTRSCGLETVVLGWAIAAMCWSLRVSAPPEHPFVRATQPRTPVPVKEMSNRCLPRTGPRVTFTPAGTHVRQTEGARPMTEITLTDRQRAILDVI